MNRKPIQQDAYEALMSYARKQKDTRIQDYFIREPGRKEAMRITGGKLKWDFSRQRTGIEGIRLMVRWAESIGIGQAAGALSGGKPVNHTERRPALHTALRSSGKEAVTVNGKDVIPEILETRERIRELSSAIRSGKLRSATGDTITDILHIGIGGSHLGPEMVYTALYDYKSEGSPEVHFLSNVDGDGVWRVLKNLDPSRTMAIVVSKSFGTVETLTNASLVREWLEAALPEKDISAQLVAITANTDKAVQSGYRREYVLPLWDWVGGRFSVWGSVGLSIAAGLGYEVYEELLRGARQMDEHFKGKPLGQNIPVLMALLSWWNIEVHGACAEAVLPYSSALKLLPAYLQQLVMESNGKSTDIEGKPVTYHTAPVIFGAAGTDAQHSFMQLIHQGTRYIPVDFIGFKEPYYDRYPESHRILSAHLEAQSRALAYGKSPDMAHLDMKIKGQAADIERLLPYRTFAGNRSSNVFVWDKLTPETLGQLLALYEHKTYIQALLWRINPFDQFGVELGKELAGKILKQTL